MRNACKVKINKYDKSNASDLFLHSKSYFFKKNR